MNSPLNANKRKSLLVGGKCCFYLIVYWFLIFLFPQKLFMDTLIKTDKPSAVSISYLKNAVENNPMNVDLRMSLAQQQFQIGQVEEAKNNYRIY